MMIDNVYDLAKTCKHYDYETFGLIYIALYKKYKSLEDSKPDEWMSSYSSYCKKVSYLGNILIYCTEIIQDFDNYSDSDINKVIIQILYYQNKYGGLKKLKLDKEVQCDE